MEVLGKAVGLPLSWSSFWSWASWGSGRGRSSTSSYGKMLSDKAKEAVVPAAAPDDHSKE